MGYIEDLVERRQLEYAEQLTKKKEEFGDDVEKIVLAAVDGGIRKYPMASQSVINTSAYRLLKSAILMLEENFVIDRSE